MDVRSSAIVAQRYLRWVIVFGVFVLAGLGMKTVIDEIIKPKPLIELGSATFQIEIVKTDDAMQKGLSGRAKMADKQAMLFEFPTDDTWGIWMKGMKFPLDIIWLDADLKVVHVETKVQPDAEPYDVYRPLVPARYVLELSAGGVEKNDIKVGRAAKLYNYEEAN